MRRKETGAPSWSRSWRSRLGRRSGGTESTAATTRRRQGDGRPDRDRRGDRHDELHVVLQPARARSGADRGGEDQRERRRRRPADRLKYEDTNLDPGETKSAASTFSARARTSSGSPATSTTRRRRCRRSCGEAATSHRASAPTRWARSGSARRASSRSASATSLRTRAPRSRRWRQAAATRAGRRQGQGARLHAERLRLASRPGSRRTAARSSRRTPSRRATRRSTTSSATSTRRRPTRSRSAPSTPGPAGVRRGAADARQQDADHRSVVGGRHVLAPEEPEGVELLGRDVRVDLRRRPGPGGARERDEDEGGGADDGRLHHRRVGDRRARDAIKQTADRPTARRSRRSSRSFRTSHELGPDQPLAQAAHGLRTLVPRDRHHERHGEARRVTRGGNARRHRLTATVAASHDDTGRPGGTLRAVAVSRSFEGVARSPRSARAPPRRGGRADRAERRRQDDARQRHHGLRHADERAGRARRARDHALAPVPARASRARADVPARASVRRPHRAGERRGLGARFRRASRVARGEPPNCSASRARAPRRARPRVAPARRERESSASRARSRPGRASC